MPVCKSYHKRQTLPWKRCVLAERNFEPSTDTGHKALIKPENTVRNPVLGFRAPVWTVAVTRHIKLGSGSATSQLDILQETLLRHYKVCPLPCHSLTLDCTLGREERERGIKQILAITAGLKLALISSICEARVKRYYMGILGGWADYHTSRWLKEKEIGLILATCLFALWWSFSSLRRSPFFGSRKNQGDDCSLV